MIVKGKQSALCNKVQVGYPVNEDSSVFNSYNVTPTHNIPIQSMNYTLETDSTDPRINFPTYTTGNYYQKIDYNVKNEQIPIGEVDSHFIALPNSSGFQLKIENIEISCPDCTVSVMKNQIKFNEPIIFDYSNSTMRILTPVFKENRVLMKDGSSVVNGYNLCDFDNNNILVRNKATLNSIENNMSEISRVIISGDYCYVTFEDSIFDGKDLFIKARGLSKIILGKSKVKSIQIDTQMTTVDSSNISKLG